MQDPIQEQASAPSGQQDWERLSSGGHFCQVFYGIGVTLGLALLWFMEICRDAFFHLLDRFNVKARRRSRASAFPPGQPRRHPQPTASN